MRFPSVVRPLPSHPPPPHRVHDLAHAACLHPHEQARKSFRELIELDEEKVACADQMCAYITKHLLHCETELQKFEEELKEKGQLKTPLLVKTESAASLAASLAAANAAVACGAASSTTAAAPAGAAAAAEAALPPHEIPPAPTTGGRRGRQPNVPAFSAQSEAPPPVPVSHKRGRGRKVSYKEAERQRQAAEAAAAAAATSGTSPRLDSAPDSNASYSPYAGGRGGRQTYPDSVLPLASREQSNAPLCGSVPASIEYIIPEGAKVRGAHFPAPLHTNPDRSPTEDPFTEGRSGAPFTCPAWCCSGVREAHRCKGKPSSRLDPRDRAQVQPTVLKVPRSR